MIKHINLCFSEDELFEFVANDYTKTVAELERRRDALMPEIRMKFGLTIMVIGLVIVQCLQTIQAPNTLPFLIWDILILILDIYNCIISIRKLPPKVPLYCAEELKRQSGGLLGFCEEKDFQDIFPVVKAVNALIQQKPDALYKDKDGVHAVIGDKSILLPETIIHPTEDHDAVSIMLNGIYFGREEAVNKRIVSQSWDVSIPFTIEEKDNV